MSENLQSPPSAAAENSTTLGKPEDSSNQICMIPQTEISQALCSIGIPSTTIPLSERSQALCSLNIPSTTIPLSERSQALCSLSIPSTTIPLSESSQALCSLSIPSTPPAESSQEHGTNLSLTKLPPVIGKIIIPLTSTTQSENSHVHDTINLLLSTIPQPDINPIAAVSENLHSAQATTPPHIEVPHAFHKINIPLIKSPVESLQLHGAIPLIGIPQSMVGPHDNNPIPQSMVGPHDNNPITQSMVGPHDNNPIPLSSAINPQAFCEVEVRGIPTPIFLPTAVPRLLHQLDNEEKPLMFPTHDQADNRNKYLRRLFPKEIPHALGKNSDTLPLLSMYSTVFSPVLDRADNGGNQLHHIFTSGNQNARGNEQIHIPALFPLDIPQVNSTKNVYKCDVCDKTFKHNDKLQNHLINHDKEQSYKCGVCGKTFNHKNDLQKHMRIHSGEKPYKCDVCGKNFSQNGYLKTHIKIHTGERSFKCEFCSKTFIVNSDLQKHKIIHSGEKPHVCDICGKGYNQKSYLQTHIRIHTGERPFECGVCGSAFADSSSLHKHMNIHSRQKSYKCDVCGKTFNQNGNRRLHMQRIHSIVETKPSI